MQGSADFRGFMADVEAGGVPTSATYDLRLLSRLEDIEREQAEVALMELANQGDRRAIETLGRAKVADAEKLLRYLASQPGDTGTLAARALLLLLGEDAAATKRVADGVVGNSPMASTMSAYTLRFQDGPDAVRGLLEALESPSGSARTNAMLGLREKLKLEPLIEPRQSPLFVLEMLAMSKLDSQWKPACATMRAGIEGLIAGKTPAEVGFAYDGGSDADAVMSFWRSVDSSKTPVDVDAFRKLSGHDREWAVVYLTSKIWRKPKLCAVIAELGLTEALPALDEALERAQDYKKPAYQEAIAALRG